MEFREILWLRTKETVFKFKNVLTLQVRKHYKQSIKVVEANIIKIGNDVVKAICNNIIYIPYIETLPTANINIVEATEVLQHHCLR